MNISLVKMTLAISVGIGSLAISMMISEYFRSSSRNPNANMSGMYYAGIGSLEVLMLFCLILILIL